MSTLRPLLLFTLISFSSLVARASCIGSITVLAPKEGALVGSRFPVAASAISGCAIAAMHVYIDDLLQYEQFQPNLSGRFLAEMGPHRVVIQAFAADGSVFKKLVHINVTSQTPQACPPDPLVHLCTPPRLFITSGPVGIRGATMKISGIPFVGLELIVGNSVIARTFNQNAAEVDVALMLPRGLHFVELFALLENNDGFLALVPVQITSSAKQCEAPFLSGGIPTNLPIFFDEFFVAADSAACSIGSLRMFVDGRLQYAQSNQGLFDGRLVIEPGRHQFTVQATNSQGVVRQMTETIEASGPVGPICAPAHDPGVALCFSLQSPGFGHIQFGTPERPSSPVLAVRIYVDNIARAQFYNFAAQRGETELKMSKGSHRITAVAWTRRGDVSTDTITLNVQ
ncbi:MAG TPA: hypothetical protein VFQ41_23545 [Candidatus Angelobacter sp.]|nr:hypothetical protein [Candidatus Angelobacter sp.]